MLGIGFTEMILIAGIALVVVGPDKFPDFAKVVIRTVRDLRGYVDDMKDEVTKELAPVKKEFNELNKMDAESYIDSLTKTEDDSRDELPDTGEDQSGYSYDEDTPGSEHSEEAKDDDKGFDDYDEHDDYANAYGEYSQEEMTGEGAESAESEESSESAESEESEEILEEYFGEDQSSDTGSPDEEASTQEAKNTDQDGGEDELSIPDRIDG